MRLGSAKSAGLALFRVSLNALKEWLVPASSAIGIIGGAIAAIVAIAVQADYG